MKEENEKKLIGEFGFFELFRHRFECDDGWFDLIYRLCKDIKAGWLKGAKKDLRDKFRVVQVKEKFGGLRFYTNWVTDRISALIDKAEEESLRTCERCGKKGKQIEIRGWVQTLCPSCAEEKRRGQ